MGEVHFIARGVRSKMKKRIKIDSSILSLIVLGTGCLFLFKKIYSQNQTFDNVMDFFGMMILLEGILLRMSARGFKKAHSKKSESLVTDGPYSVTRNPMYLGSFLMGVGFVLIAWPWWSVAIFAALFYIRFNKQMVSEEKFLKEKFGEEYENYCQKVSRIFPNMEVMLNIKIDQVFDLKVAFNTKEKRGLLVWPLLALLLESLQESLVFGQTDFLNSIYIFVCAFIVYVAILWICYQK